MKGVIANQTQATSFAVVGCMCYAYVQGLCAMPMCNGIGFDSIHFVLLK